ncbi:MAG TPA: immunity 26/phosphotriesterase HocA family protein [Acidimicrobiia bacterium]|jgi:hypothetical protein|nr:immunity 26/phosphotriesterase HocA family protein [Acidimicrobiia bacterium]
MPERRNLQELKASRKGPRPGDIFTMQLPDGKYLFGRVILADRPREVAPMPGSNLIYIYDQLSDASDPPGNLSPDHLLLPPIFTNRLPWSKGYFVTVAHRELQPTDLLPQHCFRRWTGESLDESGNELDGPTEPCGDWGLASYRMIDDLISDALGIPRVPG